MKKDSTSKAIVLLNADYSILHFIPLKRAMNLYVAGKIEIEKSDDTRMIHPKLNFGFPKIVRMKEYIYVPHNKKTLAPKKKRVLTRDSYECQYCRKKLTKLNGTIDHVIPKSNFNYPGHIWTNVVACCSPCNNKKGARTPEEAGFKLARKPFSPDLQSLVFEDRPDLLQDILELKG